MKPTRTELLDAIVEHFACADEEKRMEKEYPMGTCNAEDAWRDFFRRKERSDSNMKNMVLRELAAGRR